MYLRGRRGAENVIAALILFIAVMALATTTTIVFKNYLDRSSSAVNEQQQKTTDIMRTHFVIALATYDKVNTTYVYVKNTGSTRFHPNDIDLYIDGIRIPRNQSNRTIEVSSDTDTINPGIWDPSEELEIRIFRAFDSSQTRNLLIATPNGVTAQTEFSS
jgi:archaellum component FlaG (FlaF/FlaG flagellin family)